MTKIKHRNLIQTTWEFMSYGQIKIESNEDIQKRIKQSPDRAIR